MSATSRHELSTLDEVITLYRELPAERGDLMLKEVCEAVRYAASLHEAVGLIGATMSIMPITWINDDKGTKTINLRSSRKAKPFLSFQIGPKAKP